MLKQLTIAILVGTLLPACVLTTDDTTTSVSDSTSSDGTTAGTSTNPTTGTSDPSDGTTTVEPTTDGTTTDTPTTDATDATTGGTVTTTTDGTTTDATTTDATTGQSGYGQCGWFAEDKYYACAADGAVASLEDPDGISPIACADGLAEGDKCTEEEGPVKGVGCCTPEGTLYYCDSEGANVVVKQECGA
jgi:hypothetical protein